MSDRSQEKHALARNKRSCNRCNERKVRCDRNSPCGACVQSGNQCTFPGPKRAPRVLNRPPVRELLARLAELEAETHQLRLKHSGSQENEHQSSQSSFLGYDQSLPWLRSDTGSLSLSKGGFIGHNNPSWSHDSFRQNYFQPSQIETLWRIYQKNVAPVIAILHLPTTNAVVQDASKDLDIDPASEALLVSVCFAAVVSMTADHLQSELGLEYHKAKLAYEFALNQALSQAGFVKSPDIPTLEAAVIYLLCARVDGDTRFVWAESAVVIRLAQSQGIHRDGNETGLSPFNTEIYRRLWWHICILDMLCSEDQGVGMQIRSGTFDTRFPVNVNGDELETSMLESPPERKGFTDITLCIVTCFILKEVYLAPKPLDLVTSLEEDRIKSVGRVVHEQYLDHFNLEIPIQWATATIIRLQLSKSWVVGHSQSSSDSRNLQSSHRESVFRTAVELLEFTHFLQTNHFTAEWSWLCRSYKQKETVSYLLDELSSRPSCPETARAWHIVTEITSLWRQGSLEKGAVSEMPLLELIQRADQLRERELKRQVSGTLGSR